jgi:hypothetical protein
LISKYIDASAFEKKQAGEQILGHHSECVPQIGPWVSVFLFSVRMLLQKKHE